MRFTPFHLFAALIAALYIFSAIPAKASCIALPNDGDWRVIDATAHPVIIALLHSDRH